MSARDTIRAALLSGLIAIGSAATSEPSGNPIFKAVHALALDSAEILRSMAKRSAAGVLGVLQGP